MKQGAAILAAILVAGCAAANDTRDSRREEIQYQREAERLEALENFETFRRSCARSGGAVVVNRHYGGRVARTPTAQELKTASCRPPAWY